MKTISRIERIVNIINRAYKLGFKFPFDVLYDYNKEAYQILTDAEVKDAIDCNTKYALVTNLLLIDDNNLDDEMYVLNDVEIDAEAYLCDNAEVEDWQDVDFYWGTNQNFVWGDGMGYEVNQSGEIVGDYAWEHRYYKNENGEWEQRKNGSYTDEDFAEGKVFLDKVCDSLGRVIQLYC